MHNMHTRATVLRKRSQKILDFHMPRLGTFEWRRYNKATETTFTIGGGRDTVMY
jgi:hypothetical protein